MGPRHDDELSDDAHDGQRSTHEDLLCDRHVVSTSSATRPPGALHSLQPIRNGLSGNHLRWVLKDFVRCYNERRPHRALDLSPPEGPVESSEEGEVIRRQVLGGLVNDYYREAA
jgi:hypothetical protein